MPAIESTVTRTVQHEGNRYGIQIAGVWYNGFGKPPANEGDEVHVEYTEVQKDGKSFCNVKKCEILKAAAPKPSEDKTLPESVPKEAVTPREQCINRAVALKAAVETVAWIKPQSSVAEFTLALARRFEKYLDCEDDENVLM